LAGVFPSRKVAGFIAKQAAHAEQEAINLLRLTFNDFPDGNEFFGILFDLIIYTGNLNHILDSSSAARPQKPGFYFDQNFLYPIISRTSRIVREALALAFSAPSDTTFARYL